MDAQLIEVLRGRDRREVRPERRRMVAALERWLVERVAALAELGSEDIDVTLPFSHYALDSVATVGLTGELADLLDMALPATLVWDYPTIASLAHHLAGAEARSA